MPYPPNTRAIIHECPSARGLLRIDGKECTVVRYDPEIHLYHVRVDGFASDILVSFGELEVRPEDLPAIEPEDVFARWGDPD